MIAELRRQADDAAQGALRDLIGNLIRTGAVNHMLAARYTAAERLVDMLDEQLEAEQLEDAGAPDYFGIYTEGDVRADWGNR